MNTNVIIAAGGNSSRYGKNKLFEKLGKSNILVETIRAFSQNKNINKIIVATKPENVEDILKVSEQTGIDCGNIFFANNGNSRTETISKALLSLNDDCEIVLVHDGARPFVSQKLIDDVIDGAKSKNAAVPCLDMVDSILSVENANPEKRSNFKRVQTPQGFNAELLQKAYSMIDKCDEFTDDYSVYKKYIGGDVEIIEGDEKNIKITNPKDLKRYYTGCGYDIHRYADGNKGLVVGGVKIPFNKEFVAHSDGDVVCHALMDALLSAISEKDIGHLFPPDDDRYENANSMKMLDIVLKKVKNQNLNICNVSVSIIAERPKISPYVDDIKNSLAKKLGISYNDVGITATTNELVGEIGQNLAMASFVTIMLQN